MSVVRSLASPAPTVRARGLARAARGLLASRCAAAAGRRELASHLLCVLQIWRNMLLNPHAPCNAGLLTDADAVRCEIHPRGAHGPAQLARRVRFHPQGQRRPAAQHWCV